MQFPEAQRLVEEWARYVNYRRRNHKTPQSTAEHIHRFETQRLAQPWGARRDPSRNHVLLSDVARDMRRAGWSDKEILGAYADSSSSRRDPQRGRRTQGTRRDPAPRRMPQALASVTHLRKRPGSPRAGAGQPRVSAKGIPYSRCGHGLRLQAVFFPRAYYTVASAKAWARKHDFVQRKVEETPNFIRIQLVPSELFMKGSFRNIPLSEKHHIRGLVGCPRVSIGGLSSRRGVKSPGELVHFRIPGERRKVA